MTKFLAVCFVVLSAGFASEVSAQEKQALVDETKHYVLKAAHPSPFSADKGFFGCKHFSKTNQLLMQQGLDPIDWNINPH